MQTKLAEIDGLVKTQINEGARKLKTQIDSSVKFIEGQLQQQQKQLNKISEEIAFDVNRIDKSAKRANKMVFEL